MSLAPSHYPPFCPPGWHFQTSKLITLELPLIQTNLWYSGKLAIWLHKLHSFKKWMKRSLNTTNFFVSEFPREFDSGGIWNCLRVAEGWLVIFSSHLCIGVLPPPNVSSSSHILYRIDVSLLGPHIGSLSNLTLIYSFQFFPIFCLSSTSLTSFKFRKQGFE